jgi:LuxR family maltose regulon positive regulatory protein
MLETLEHQNLFLLPLDDSRSWYRYHQLFGDFLRHRLIQRFPEDVAVLHRRASDWYLEQSVPEAAFQHALAADDPALLTYSQR